MYRFVHIVPVCPRCGSQRTGRYIVSSFTNGNRSEELKFRKHGEIVKLAAFFHSNNLFCEDCEFEWTGVATRKLMNKESLNAWLKELEIDTDEIDEMEFKVDKAVAPKNNKLLHNVTHVAGWVVKRIAKSAVSAAISPFTDAAELFRDKPIKYDEDKLEMERQKYRDEQRKHWWPF